MGAMQSWYYSKDREQRGPVSLDELRRLVGSGELKPDSDLAWTEGMTDWKPPEKIPELFSSNSPTVASTSQGGFNPYAAPVTSPENLLAPLTGGTMIEIEPGSVDLEVMGCLRKGFELTKRHFGTLMLIGFVYFVVSILIGAVEGLISNLLVPQNTGESGVVFHPLMIPIKLASSLVSVVLAAGLTRASLNIVSGSKATVGDLFSQIGKVVTLSLATLLFYIMLGFGFLLFIVPGVYVALRFGFFVSAIVDRDLGPIEALKYCYRITTNNALSLFGLFILSMVIIIAGMVALFFGLLVAIPVVTLAFSVAYRFLQYGPEAMRVTESSNGSALAGR